MYDYDKAIESVGLIKAHLNSMKSGASYHVVGMADALLDVLEEHSPRKGVLIGAVDCGSSQCHEDGGYDGAFEVSWPCDTVKPLFDRVIV